MSNPWTSRPPARTARQMAVDAVAESLGAPRPYTVDPDEAAQVAELRRARQAGSRVAVYRHGPTPVTVVGTLLDDGDARIRIATAELPHGQAWRAGVVDLIDLPPE